MLSIIIPTYNEAKIIRKTTIEFLQGNLVAKMLKLLFDGGSTDETVEIVESLESMWFSPLRRAGQMNYGKIC
jgi:glycosyltransferase involved in cell wall biosynthesis